MSLLSWVPSLRLCVVPMIAVGIVEVAVLGIQEEVLGLRPVHVAGWVPSPVTLWELEALVMVLGSISYWLFANWVHMVELVLWLLLMSWLIAVIGVRFT